MRKAVMIKALSHLPRGTSQCYRAAWLAPIVLVTIGLWPSILQAEKANPLQIPFSTSSKTSKKRTPPKKEIAPSRLPQDFHFLPSPISPQATEESSIPTLPDFKADYAFAAYQRGFYKTALGMALQRAARSPNDGPAMTLAGEIYAKGLGVKTDLQEATKWYKRASKANDPNATFALAMIFMSESASVKPPLKQEKHLKAIALLEKAADAGHPLAAYNLAVSLLSDGQAERLTRAAKLLEKAAQTEVPDAQYRLAVLLREGHVVEANLAQAAQWMARAAANDNIAAQVEFAIMLFNGKGIEADEERAARLFALAAARGNAVAQNRLARILVAGRGLPPNLVQAASWHFMASAQGNEDSWLDAALKNLTEEERQQATRLAQQRIEALHFGL